MSGKCFFGWCSSEGDVTAWPGNGAVEWMVVFAKTGESPIRRCMRVGRSARQCALGTRKWQIAMECQTRVA